MKKTNYYQQLKKLKTIKKIALEQGKITSYDIRMLKKKRKILKTKNKLARNYDEPQKIANFNNVHKDLDREDIKFLFETFNELNDINKQVNDVKKQEKGKLLANKKVFRIKW